jgi:hypothetical protein
MHGYTYGYLRAQSCSKHHWSLQAAEQSQQRGERRSGRGAIPHFQEAVQKYRQCMGQDPDTETLTNAQILCSESLQMWAKAIIETEEQLPDSEQSISVEKEANQRALELYSEAVQVGTLLMLLIIAHCGVPSRGPV